MAPLKLKQVRPVLGDDQSAPPPKTEQPAASERSTAAPAKRRRAAPAKLPPEGDSATPRARRRQTSLTLIPQLLERQEGIAADLSERHSKRISFAQLFAATAFYAIPDDVDDAHELVLRWARLRAATTDPYQGARGREINVRLDEVLAARFDRLTRELRRRGVNHPRSALANAALHFDGPAGVDDGADQLARYELAKLDAASAAA